MNIVVMCKSVPDTMDVRFDPETKTMVRAGVATIINPFDLFAIEEGLRQRERHGGTVTAITMGPLAAKRELQDAIAMGCERDGSFRSPPPVLGPCRRRSPPRHWRCRVISSSPARFSQRCGRSGSGACRSSRC